MKKAQMVFNLHNLQEVLNDRKQNPKPDSYTAMLFNQGPISISKKLLEEVLEAAIEFRCGTRERQVNELADIFYHALALGTCGGITLEDIEKCLAARHSENKSGSAPSFRPGAWGKYRVKGRLSLKSMLLRSGLPSIGDAQVVLFSHRLNDTNRRRAQEVVPFSIEAKEIKTQLQQQGVKVKLGVPPDSPETFVTRRADFILPPIIFVAEHIVLPLCVHILASYLKGWLDRRRQNRKSEIASRKLTLVVGVAGDLGREEKWYMFEGTAKDILKELEAAVIAPLQR
jgi:phosphoribosyl-ATP pyrophosphohydrolase